MAKELDMATAKEARRLLLDAAMDLTRLTTKMRRACRLVLLDGVSQSDAARRVQVDRQNVYRAIRKLRPKLRQVTDYAGIGDL